MGGLLAWAALNLGRVDGELGAPKGPGRLVQASDPAADAQAAIANATQALRYRPIDGRAYRVLAQARQAQGDAEQATALFRIAAERWPRDRMAQAMMAEQAMLVGDWPTAFTHLDALLRVAPRSRQALLAALLPQLEAPPLRDALLERLALDPPWRSALPAALLADTTPPVAAEALLADLAKLLPPTAAEIRARSTLLQRMGRADAARTAWLDTLPAADRALAVEEGNHVFDGGFELGTLAGGHDWQATMPPGVTAGVGTQDPRSGTRALSLSFSGRAVQFAHLQQSLALPPGNYRLQAWSDDRVRAARPFAWQLACVDGGARLVELPLPGGTGWQPAQADFQVPHGCNAQRLVLRHTGRNLAERRLRGTLRIDGVAIRQLESGTQTMDTTRHEP